MKKCIIVLAKILPSKVVSDRVLPWTTLIFSVFAGVIALYQYYYDIEAKKVTETIKLHREFIGLRPNTESIFEIQTTLIEINTSLGKFIDKTRCEYINQLIEGKEINVLKKFDCNNTDLFNIISSINLNTMQRKKLRGLLENNINFSKKQKIQIFRILGFYKAVITCASQKACDNTSTVELFAEPMISFINSYCTYFDQSAREWNGNPADDTLVEFLINNGIKLKSYKKTDNKREKVFRCERHRAME